MQNRKKLVFKRYPWYYEYKKLFYDHPGVNLSIFIESQQPTRCDGQIVNNIELRGYNKDFQERKSPLLDSGRLSDQNGGEDVVQNNKDEFDSSSLYSVLSQIAQDKRRATKKLTKNAAIISDNKI